MNLEQQTDLAGRIVPGGRVLRAWTPAGGVSTEVTALEIEQPAGGVLRVILRHPPFPEREFNLLQTLHANGLPVPAPLGLEPPYVATELVEGRTIEAPSDLAEMAVVLAAIHRLDVPWLPAAGGLAAVNPPGLLHGDYWPGNIVWRDGRIVAVVDWEDAARGDPLADLANTRLEILWACGADPMATFTERYRSLAPHLDYATLPAWDLQAGRRVEGKIGGWGLPPEREEMMRARLRSFLARAAGERR